MTSELTPKRLELLKDAVSSMSRVLVLSYLTDPIASPQVKALEAAAPSLGVKLQIQEIRSGDDLPAAFDAAAREGPEGLLVTAESIFNVNRKRVTELAAPSGQRRPAACIDRRVFPPPKTHAGQCVHHHR